MATTSARSNGSVVGSSMPSLASDATLEPFLTATFDPAEYLNNALTPWQGATQREASASLSELAAQTQSLVSQLNAQLTRLSSTLTQLTDEILRSGSRLAYEVELLRGDTVTLSEAVTQGLRGDVEKFVAANAPPGIAEADRGGETALADVKVDLQPGHAAPSNGEMEARMAPTMPGYVVHLRTLSTVRARLDSVIKVFGDAMDWTLPASESGYRHSNAPTASSETGPTIDAGGNDYEARVRTEITELLRDEALAADHGLEVALRRIEGLKDLAQVWKGTAEEKSRQRFIDSLAKIAQDTRR